MTRTNILLSVFVITASVPLVGWAHGVSHRTFEVGTGIEATYDDGRPMAFCDVEVFSPADSEAAYQVGSTDPQGCFAFVPNTNGLWRITVDDGMGHTVTAQVQTDATAVPKASTGQGLSRPLGLLVGLSIIFGFFGVYSLARQATRHRTPATGCSREECECTSPKA